MVYLDELSIQQIIEAFNRRDLEPASKLFAEEVLLHCPGKSRISGDYSGKTGVMELWRKQIDFSDGTFQGKVITACQGEGVLILIMEAKVLFEGQQVSWRRVNHYQVKEGRVVEGWIYESDQSVVDAVYA